MLLNSGAREEYWESLEQRGQTSSILNEIIPDYSLERHAAAEAPILWPPHVKRRLIWKDPDAGKDWRQEEKRAAEDEMVGWHHQLNGPEFEQIQGESEGQGSLMSCSPWGRKELDTTEQLNNKIKNLQLG